MRIATAYGSCARSATCWARTLDGPADADACATCWQSQLGLPWAGDAQRAAKDIAFMTDEERARLRSAALRSATRMTGGTR